AHKRPRRFMAKPSSSGGCASWWIHQQFHLVHLVDPAQPHRFRIFRVTFEETDSNGITQCGGSCAFPPGAKNADSQLLALHLHRTDVVFPVLLLQYGTDQDGEV